MDNLNDQEAGSASRPTFVRAAGGEVDTARADGHVEDEARSEYENSRGVVALSARELERCHLFWDGGGAPGGGCCKCPPRGGPGVLPPGATSVYEAATAAKRDTGRVWGRCKTVTLALVVGSLLLWLAVYLIVQYTLPGNSAADHHSAHDRHNTDNSTIVSAANGKRH